MNTRDPIFDRVDHQSFFCIDGLYLDDLSKGLLFKVKDAAASVTQKKQKQDILGWALVQPDSLLWKAGMDDSASREYQGEVDYTLELELVHPVELVTGLAGNIHLICRPAREQEVEECRKKGWGYFKAYEHEEDTHIMERVELASTPPLRDDQAVEVNAAHELL